ncbi:DHH family phosphoesterase [Candidatus Roizmanbacteria bacterium]|nr:DHH family phosphoesterase [Candidatus Roizmanbacteria bacterium]
MKKWETLYELSVDLSAGKAGSEELGVEKLIDILLENRGIKTAKEREDFFHPRLENVTPKAVGIDLKQLKKALARIVQAIEKQEQIIIFGDYDVDGITGSAILWETLHKMGAKVLPYIPHRVDEGYGLSVKGISNLIEKFPETCHPELVSGSSKNDKKMLKQVQHDRDCLGVRLIITTDNGIVAHEAVEFANQNNIDVIITDHHTPPAGGGEKLPDAYAVVHTTKLCGAGVAYLLAQELRIENGELKNIDEDVHLELATLGTVADLVPLTGANRAIVKEGLKILSKTKRLGLLELYKNAGIEKDIFEPYEIGFVIGPRLNASGRIESAMDSLRLLCTTNRERAAELAAKLELINKERQQLLKEAKEDAIAKVKSSKLKLKSLLFIADENYAQGIIGLVAGKLVEEFYRPAIVVSIGEKHSKASVRSVSGFNIIEFLRLHAEHFINVGGHPMAAGFTVETEKLLSLKKVLEDKADELLTEEILTRRLKIDCELPFSAITKEFFDAVQQLAPFGMGNSEPVFATKSVLIDDLRIMGKDGSHLKLVLRDSGPSNSAGRQARMTAFEAVGFGFGHLAAELSVGDVIDVAYTIDENTWNRNTKLQLKVKDIKNNFKSLDYSSA